MRFNQVIRAELRAGACGLGVAEYQTGLGAGLGKWKSHLQLSWGPGEQGLWQAPSWPLRTNCSAVTSAWGVQLGRVCRSQELDQTAPMGWVMVGGGGGKAVIRPQVIPPWKQHLPSTSSAQTSRGYHLSITIQASRLPTLRVLNTLLLSHQSTKTRRLSIPVSGEPTLHPTLILPQCVLLIYPSLPGLQQLSPAPTTSSLRMDCALCLGHPPHPPLGLQFAVGH